MNFAILTESKYFETTLLNVQQIQRFHSDAEIFIGYLGLKHNEWDALHAYGCIMYDLTDHAYSSETLKMILKPAILSVLKLPVCYMDADAVLMKPMDLKPKGDMIVTTRVSRHGKINSGVFIASSRFIMLDWERKAYLLHRETGERLSEQNALNWMFDNTDYDFHEVPCDIYNYPKIEQGIPDEVVVAHLKSGRYKKPELVQIVRDKCNI